MRGLAALLDRRRMTPDPGSPAPFRGGFLGWISYDVGRHVEKLPDRHGPDPAVPDFVLAEYECLAVEDRLERRLFVTGGCDADEGPSRLVARQAELADLLQELAAGRKGPEAASDAGDVSPGADCSHDEYLRRLRRVIDYIAAGDVFQANLAQSFRAPFRGSRIGLYERLRAASPAPYGCWLDLGGPTVMSISPELFLERRGERVVTRPIKGTRPRGTDEAEDARLRAELHASEKDRAELAMIVDLLRNDLGRVAETGSVVVDEERVLEAHPTVHHAVATVSARVARSVGTSGLLAATMPGGSVTGAPKIRAMEILDELEDVRRGPYCGSAGWFGWDGDMVTNILIRTLVATGDEVSFHVGGGIVADSEPGAEYDETLDKAAALLSALQPGRRPERSTRT